MVKRSYNRFFYIIGFIACFLLSFILLKNAWDDQQSLSPICTEFCSDIEHLRKEAIATSVMALLMAIGLVFLLQAAEKHEQRRQLAAQRSLEVDRLANNFSPSDSMNLSLPLEIRTRLTSRTILQLLAVTGGIISFILIVGLGAYVIQYSPLRYSDYLIIIVFAFFVYIAMMVIILFVAASIRTRMVISENGMSLHANGRNRHISWHEVKLFAHPPLASDKKVPLQFEIASTSKRIVWDFPAEQHGFLAGPQPTMPYIEYVRIMEALPAFIAAKTGLPLYDLRK